MTNKEIILQAFGEVGTKEVPGEGNNPDIVKYHAFATVKNEVGAPDSVPWCASNICWVLESIGLKSTNSKMARSFEKLGVEIPFKDFLPGDLIVMHRNGIDSGSGHVGIGLRVIPSPFGNKGYLLGGNQSDEVNITKYSLSKMTAIRRVSDKLIYTEKEKQELRELAEKMISNQGVDSGTKVT